jgi:hypothetical protein
MLGTRWERGNYDTTLADSTIGSRIAESHDYDERIRHRAFSYMGYVGKTFRYCERFDKCISCAGFKGEEEQQMTVRKVVITSRSLMLQARI